MKCNECREMFSPYYDGELKQAGQFIEHLRSCGSCKQEFARYTESLAALKSLAGELDVPWIAESVREAVAESRTGQAARWRQIVASDMKVVSEMLRPAKGGLVFVAAVAAAAVLLVVLAYTLLPSTPQVQPAPSVAKVEEPESPVPEPIYDVNASQKDMVRIEGQWVTKEEALSQLLAEKGYAEYQDWFLPEEDATRLAMGLVPHEDTWLTPEELVRRHEPVESPPAPVVVQKPAEPEKVAPEIAPSPEVPKEEMVQEPEKPAPEKEFKTDERPVVTDQPVQDNEVAAFLATVLPDEVESHEGLMLISLTRQEQDWEGKGSFYVSLGDAVNRGLAEIRETGTVSKLLVVKKPGIAVFSVGGGIVIGGWQNRLVGPDIVLSPETTEAEIAVYCAEQGRWKGSKTFQVADYLAVAELRKKSYSGEEQDYIWRSIKELRKSQNIRSSSSSVHKLYEKRSIKKQIASFEKAFARWKSQLTNKPHTIGIAVVLDDRIVGADLFVNNHLLMEHYDLLVRTYAVEAALAQAGEKEQPAQEQMREKVGEFIACAARSSYNSSGDASYLEYRITDTQSDLYGYALTTRNVPVHVSLFADNTGLRETRVVTRPPRPVKKAEDAPDEEPDSARHRALSLEEAAAAKLRREGKAKPGDPLPRPLPQPKSPRPVAPDDSSQKNKFIAPGFPGR